MIKVLKTNHITQIGFNESEMSRCFDASNNSARCWAVSLEVIQTVETMKGPDKSRSDPFMAMIRDKTAGAFLIKQNPLTFHNNNGAKWADWSRVIPVYFIGDALTRYSLVAPVLPRFILASLWRRID